MAAAAVDVRLCLSLLVRRQGSADDHFPLLVAEGMGFRGRVGFAGRGGFRGGRGGFMQPGLGGPGGRQSNGSPAPATATEEKSESTPASSTEDATAGGAEGGKWSDEPTAAESAAAASAPVEGSSSAAPVESESKPEPSMKAEEAKKDSASNGAPALTAAQKGKGVSGRIVPKGATMSWAQIAKCGRLRPASVFAVARQIADSRSCVEQACGEAQARTSGAQGRPEGVDGIRGFR